jgi:hypothetical protein
MSRAIGDEPGVDIVVNNHDYGRYLGDAIDSALAQTHPNVHVVVVDDGSTDDSREIISGYGDRVETVLKEQGGQASAINAGFERCKGDVVLFLDADDRLHPEAAARVAAAFAADERLAKVQFRTEIIDADGNATGIVKPLPHLPMPNGDLRQDELVRPFDIVWMATSANAFRRSALERILPVPEQAYPRTGADWYLVHLTALLGDVRSLQEVGGYYRVHGGNSYEAAGPVLDLDRVRKAISYTAATRPELLRLAGEIGLPRPRRILSTADVAYRMISLAVDPSAHPVAGERRIALLRDGAGALARRTDISLAMKAMLGGWFLAMTVAPRRLAARLAVLFLFPERRVKLNAVLGRLHRREPEPEGEAA